MRQIRLFLEYDHFFLHSPTHASAKIIAMITEETNIKVNIETDLTCMPTDQITGFGNARKEPELF